MGLADRVQALNHDNVVLASHQIGCQLIFQFLLAGLPLRLPRQLEAFEDALDFLDLLGERSPSLAVHPNEDVLTGSSPTGRPGFFSHL